MAQFALTLGRLLGQDMTGKSFITSDFAGSSLSETFGSSAVGLDLGHCFSPWLFIDHNGGAGKPGAIVFHICIIPYL